MALDFAAVCMFFLVGFGFVFVNLLVGKLLRPHNPTADKTATYECGERTIGPAWVQFNPRFYSVALMFLIFDVEVAFIFPIAMVLKQRIASGNGAWSVAALVVFLALLFVGLIYVWAKGDLRWVQSSLAPEAR